MRSSITGTPIRTTYRVNDMSELTDLIQRLPKAELHLHIEGTLEPAMMMQLAERHSVELPYKSLEDVAAAYNFSDLQSFLDLYYLGAGVLRTEEDFFDLMMAYFRRCQADGIVHAEIMFDPQTHTERGIDFAVFMNGFAEARRQAAELGISSELIMSFLRHLPEADAIETLKTAEPYREQILAIGLDSSEKGFPPSGFVKVYEMAGARGYRLSAHAGEEGPPAYITEALDLLKVERIDHGVRCLEDPAVVERLAQENIPLTVCPLSNIKLCVFDDMADHPLLIMLEAGLNVCVNSDDPPYFGGYLMDNFAALEASLGLTESQAKQLVANSINSSFLPDDRKAELLAAVG